METRQKELTPKRWAAQNEWQRAVWEHVDKIAVPRVVRAALAKKAHIFDLYLSLARLRAKTELVKNVSGRHQDITSLLRQNTHYIHPQFGQVTTSNLSEKGLDSDYWGDDVKAFLQQRSGLNKTKHEYSFIGLSAVSPDELQHSTGLMLRESDPYFQNMQATRHIFEFLINAASLLHDLLNYPTIWRGNAAICEWIVEKTFQIKFGDGFSNPFKMMPHLTDWISFLEAPQEFTQFFVISVTANILLSFPELTAKECDYLQSIPALMNQNPYEIANEELRLEMWANICGIISRLMRAEVLTRAEKESLQRLGSSELSFSKAFFYLRRLHQNPNENPIGEECAYVKKILNLHYSLPRIHHQRLRTEAMSVDFNQTWFDVEVLRNLDLRYSPGIIARLTSQFHIARPNKHESGYVTGIAQERYYFPYSHYGKTAEGLICASLISVEEKNSFSEMLTQELNQPRLHAETRLVERHFRLAAAIVSGGLTVRDLLVYREDQIDALITPQAVFLYNSLAFIRASDLVANSASEIEKNVVTRFERLTDKHLYVDVLAQQHLLAASFAAPHIKLQHYNTTIAEFLTLSPSIIEMLLKQTDIDRIFVLEVYAHLCRSEALSPQHELIRHQIKLEIQAGFIANTYVHEGNLAGIDFSNCHLHKVEFSGGVNLRGASFNKAVLEHVKFTAVKLEDADFFDVTIKGRFELINSCTRGLRYSDQLPGDVVKQIQENENFTENNYKKVTPVIQNIVALLKENIDKAPMPYENTLNVIAQFVKMAQCLMKTVVMGHGAKRLESLLADRIEFHKGSSPRKLLRKILEEELAKFGFYPKFAKQFEAPQKPDARALLRNSILSNLAYRGEYNSQGALTNAMQVLFICWHQEATQFLDRPVRDLIALLGAEWTVFPVKYNHYSNIWDAIFNVTSCNDFRSPTYIQNEFIFRSQGAFPALYAVIINNRADKSNKPKTRHTSPHAFYNMPTKQGIRTPVGCDDTVIFGLSNC